jgi:type IV pilus assembly protein PilN
MSAVLINLLPHREAKRQQRRQAFFIGLFLAALAGLLLLVLWYGWQQQMLSSQEARNTFLKEEAVKLDEQIKDVTSLKSEIEALRARQAAVENLQTDRNIPVHLLNELVAQTPAGIFVKTIKQDGESVMVSGIAQTNERVSEFLRNTAYNSPWFERPELQEIKAAVVQLSDSKDGKHLFEFSVKLGLKRPQGAQDVQDAGVAGAVAPASN